MTLDKEPQESGKYKINYGHSVISVPGAVVSKLKGARKQDISVLFELLENPDASEETIASDLECDVPSVESALAYWRGAGILSAEGDDPQLPVRQTEKAGKTEKKAVGLGAVPLYSSEEVADISTKNPGIAAMIDECQRILGKMFGQTDSMRMVSVVEYFGLDPEYMLLACAHCSGIGQKSVGYVIKTVTGLCDRGITTVETLNDYLFAVEASAKFETQVRKLFGMNMSRELTEREKGFLTEWSDKYSYGIEIVKKAYNITIDTIGEPSLNYANAILSKWYTSELKTAEQIDAYLAAEKNKKKSAEPGKSFDSSDFFAAALARSYGSAESAPKTQNAPADSKRNFGVNNKNGKV